MAYTYLANGILEKASKLGINIEPLILDLQSLDTPQEVTSRFNPFYPYWWKRYDPYRLIMRLVSLSDLETFIVCLCDLLHANRNDFINLSSRGSSIIDPLCEEQKLRKWLKKNKTIEAKPLPVLPSELHTWIYCPSPPTLSMKQDFHIYESHKWTMCFHLKDFLDYWESFLDLILNVTFQVEELISKNSFYNHFGLISKDNEAILYHASQLQGQNIIFLISPFRIIPSDEIIKDALASVFQLNIEDIISSDQLNRLKVNSLKYRDNKTLRSDSHLRENKNENSIKETDKSRFYFSIAKDDRIKASDILARRSRKAYSSLFLVDKYIWHKIQENKEANLALSHEEEKILDGVYDGSISLPLFINGSAGSGKTTMLCHLFASYLYAKYDSKDFKRDLLFLTYNEGLLQQARNNIEEILSCNAEYVNAKIDINRLNFDSCFKSFRAFMKELLTSEESKKRFNVNDGESEEEKDNNLTFSDFKKLYNNPGLPNGFQHPIAKKIPAEFAWYVIRTYIKGYYSDSYLNSDDYESLTKKNKLVDSKLFDQIYKNVWKPWYKPLTSENDSPYWDDQDLVRQVYSDIQSMGKPKKSYTVIFCDEAQDFTRMEIKTVINLIEFLGFDISDFKKAQLPFVLAGDPLQTLNPTGFRWSQVNDMFYDEIISRLDPFGRAKLNFHSGDLKFNYRSQPQLVKAVNLLQLWRRSYFDNYEIRPQEAWFSEEGFKPEIFTLNVNINETELIKYIENTIIVVPCEQDKEVEFVEGDEVLSNIYTYKIRNHKGKKPKNILSSANAKGLEFDRVILYKFGEIALREGIDIKKAKIESEYFLNKLYIGASRAKNFLFVVDTAEGVDYLWSRTKEESHIDKLLTQIKDPENWRGKVGTFQEGRSADGLREEHPEEIAVEFENKGMSQNNPDLLWRAWQYYNSIGKTEDKIRCEAHAYLIEGHYKKAGQSFEKLGQTYQAVAMDCYWRGYKEKCWIELQTIYVRQRSKSKLHQFRSQLIDFMLAKTVTPKLLLSFIKNIRGLIGETAPSSAEHPLDFHNIKENEISNPQWRLGIEKLLKEVLKMNKEDFKTEQWADLSDFIIEISTLKKLSDSVTAQVLARCYFYTSEFEQAVEFFEKAEETDLKEYKEAMAKFKSPPENLKYLEELGMSDTILQLWEEAKEPNDKIWFKYVLKILKKKKDHRALDLALSGDDVNEVKQLLKRHKKNFAEKEYNKRIISLYELIIRKYSVFYSWKEIDKNKEKISPKNEIDRLFFIVLRKLARNSQDFVNQKNKMANENFFDYVDEVSNFFRSKLKTGEYRNYLTVQETGLVTELLGRHVTSLEFYEDIIDSKQSTKFEVKFAKKRWVAVKQSRIEWLKKKGNQLIISENKEELRKNLMRWKVDSQQPDLPQLVEFSPGKIEGISKSEISSYADGLRLFNVKSIAFKINFKNGTITIKDILSDQQWEYSNQSSKDSKTLTAPITQLHDGLKDTFDTPDGRLSLSYEIEDDHGHFNAQLGSKRIRIFI